MDQGVELLIGATEPAVPYKEFVIIRESTSAVVWSNDYFETDIGRDTYTADSGVICGFPGGSGGCGWYCENGTFHWTTDGGSTWNTETMPTGGGSASMSDDGQYIILNGDESASGRYHKCYNPTEGWYTVTSSVYSSYGGNGSDVTRDGELALGNARDYGMIYNNNYLASGSWAQGINVSNNAFRTPRFCWDKTGWIWGNRVGNVVHWRNDTTSLSASSYNYTIGTILNMTGAFKNSRFFVTKGTNVTYTSNNATTMSIYHATNTRVIASDDAYTKIWDVNYAGGGTFNGNTVTYVYQLCFYVSRNGLFAMYYDTNLAQLMFSDDGGSSWTDRTPAAASFNAPRMYQQWNHSHF